MARGAKPPSPAVLVDNGPGTLVNLVHGKVHLDSRQLEAAKAESHAAQLMVLAPVKDVQGGLHYRTTRERWDVGRSRELIGFVVRCDVLDLLTGGVGLGHAVGLALGLAPVPHNGWMQVVSGSCSVVRSIASSRAIVDVLRDSPLFAGYLFLVERGRDLLVVATEAKVCILELTTHAHRMVEDLLFCSLRPCFHLVVPVL
ncbi:hypothetical protein PG985_005274 [Apiospora marii]|uniref:uncharacterized protein n=1 Tax=Apiospora marii TaxID=335849 RepID=UPI00312E198F